MNWLFKLINWYLIFLSAISSPSILMGKDPKAESLSPMERAVSSVHYVTLELLNLI